MPIPIQLDFFKSDEEAELEAMRESIDNIKKSCDKVRKGTYARIGELTKECYELRMRLEIIERNICRGKNGTEM